ncbi:MAG: Thiol-disulfide isomerase-like protein [Chlorobi bacterium]|nr:Thiol-disulfide isomerase-like protein [Chlorobiota bacterium]
MRTRFLLLAIPALCLGLTLSATSQSISSLTTQLATTSGEQTTVAKLGTGKVTVVSFWATWCKPCKEEMKAMSPIYQKMKDKLQYVAISIDNTKTMARVAPFIKSQGYEFPVLLDPNSDVFRALNGSNVPYTLVFNADGTLHSRHDGYLEGDQTKLEKELESMLGAGGTTSTGTN